MSHITKIDIVIRDLEALEAACQELGAELVRGVETYAWFGRNVGGNLPEGFTTEMLGKCTHVIRVPGVEYEVGVVRMADGTFTLLYDFWGPGAGLQKAFCIRTFHPSKENGGIDLVGKLSTGLEKLKQVYGIHVASRAAKAKGYTVQRKLVGETIKLTINA